ncbi:MAG: hypothetical protein ACK4GW_15350, partial [Pseudorhodobacter sp.]
GPVNPETGKPDDPGTTGFIRLDGLAGAADPQSATARPFDITLDPSNHFVLVSDAASNRIFVIDIRKGSSTQYQLVETVTVASAGYNLREIAITPDGRQLIVTATTSTGGPDMGLGEVRIYDLPKLGGNAAGRVAGTFGPAVFSRSTFTDPVSGRTNQLRQPYGVQTVIGPAVREAVGGSTYAFITDKSSDSNGVIVFVREGNVWTELNSIPFNLGTPPDLPDRAFQLFNTTRRDGILKDGLEVNDAAGIVLSPDLQYAFVMGQNRFVQGNFTRDPAITAFPQFGTPTGQMIYPAGSAIGIIADPFNENARVIGMLRPVTNAFGTDLAFSGDGLTLYAAQGARGAFFGYDFEALSQVLASYRANPVIGSFSLAEFAVNDLTPVQPDAEIAPALVLRREGFSSSGSRIGIYRDIDIAADFAIWKDGNAFVERDSTTDQSSPNIPVGTGGIARSVESQAPFLGLVSPKQTDGSVPPRPTFVWNLGGRKLESTLYIAVAAPGEGLFPEDTSDGLVKELEAAGFVGMTAAQLDQYDLRLAGLDGNRNRIYMRNFEAPADGGEVRFTLPAELALTRGQTYFWGVGVNDGAQRLFQLSESFRVAPERTDGEFANITIITHDMSVLFDGGPTDGAVFDLAREIATRNDGVLAVHDQRTGKFNSITPGREVVADGRPLVILMDWSHESSINDSGFAEAAADGMFAALAALHIQTGEKVFGADMHFIGHGRGAVVNSEIVQRMFHHFPITKGTPDIHFTTLDPVDHANPQLRLPIAGFLGNLSSAANAASFIAGAGAVAATSTGAGVTVAPALGTAAVNFKRIGTAIDAIKKLAELSGFGTLDWTDFKDPEIRIWDGVDFADNYYQQAQQRISSRDVVATGTASYIKKTTGIGTGLLFSPKSDEISLTMQGRALDEADLNVNLTGFPGFIEDDFWPKADVGVFGNLGIGWGTVHDRVVAHYAGTAALNRTSYGLAADPIFRSLFDWGGEGPQFAGEGRSPYYNETAPKELNVQSWYRARVDNAGQTPAFPTITGARYNPTTGPLIDTAPWEGIGTGWFFSDLGGGIAARPGGASPARPDASTVSNTRYGNALDPVPVLFNGDFQSSFRPFYGRVIWPFGDESHAYQVPGWSFQGGSGDNFQFMVDLGFSPSFGALDLSQITSGDVGSTVIAALQTIVDKVQQTLVDESIKTATGIVASKTTLARATELGSLLALEISRDITENKLTATQLRNLFDTLKAVDASDAPSLNPKDFNWRKQLDPSKLKAAAGAALADALIGMIPTIISWVQSNFLNYHMQLSVAAGTTRTITSDRFFMPKDQEQLSFTVEVPVQVIGSAALAKSLSVIFTDDVTGSPTQLSFIGGSATLNPDSLSGRTRVAVDTSAVKGRVGKISFSLTLAAASGVEDLPLQPVYRLNIDDIGPGGGLTITDTSKDNRIA